MRQTQKKLQLKLRYGYEPEVGYSYVDVRDQNEKWVARIWGLGDCRYGCEFVQHSLPTQLELTVSDSSFEDAAWKVLQFLNALQYHKELTGTPCATSHDLPDDIRNFFFGEKPNYRQCSFGHYPEIIDQRDNPYLDVSHYTAESVVWA